MKSSTNNVGAKVSHYETEKRASLVYTGSVLWFLVLFSTDVIFAFAASGAQGWSSGGYDAATPLFVLAACSASAAFVFQTADALWYDHLYWPLQAVKWTCELFAASAIVTALAFSLTIADPHRPDRVAANCVLLFGHLLFTSSSLSVTLEYLYRCR